MIGWILVGLIATAVVTGLITTIVLRIKQKERQKQKNALNAAIVSAIDWTRNRVTLQDLESREEFMVEGDDIADEIHVNEIIIGDDSQNEQFQTLKEIGFTDEEALQAMRIRYPSAQQAPDEYGDNGVDNLDTDPDVYYVNYLNVVALRDAASEFQIRNARVCWINRQQAKVGLLDVDSGLEYRVVGQCIGADVRNDMMISDDMILISADKEESEGQTRVKQITDGVSDWIETGKALQDIAVEYIGESVSNTARNVTEKIAGGFQGVAEKVRKRKAAELEKLEKAVSSTSNRVTLFDLESERENETHVFALNEKALKKILKKYHSKEGKINWISRHDGRIGFWDRTNRREIRVSANHISDELYNDMVIRL